MENNIFEVVSRKKAWITVEPVLSSYIVKSEETWREFSVFKLAFQKKIVFEYLGRSEREISCWDFLNGVFYRHTHIIGFYNNGLHLQAKSEKIVNLCCSTNAVYLLKDHAIYQFSPKRSKSIGLFKMPIVKLIEIHNIYEHFSQRSLKRHFVFGHCSNFTIIASLNKIGIIENNAIIQRISLSCEVVRINSELIEGINRDFYIKHSEKAEHTEKTDFQPSAKTLVALNSFWQLRETVDLFFMRFISNNLEKRLASDWHLDPLDRGYLSSENFYEEKLYDYLQSYLSLSVQGLFLTNPDSLLRLQEALREQESRIYADGHLQPDKTIASLITSSLPLPSSYDTGFQSNIRSLFLNSLK